MCALESMSVIEEETARVYSICMGTRKGAPKVSVDRAYLRENHGVDFDCHAGPGNRQVSILAREDITALRRESIFACPGDFAENITVEGVDLSVVPSGSTLKIGDALLRITGAGKPEWKKGDYSFQGIPMVARSGLFARVIRGGWIRPGDSVKVI